MAVGLVEILSSPFFVTSRCFLRASAEKIAASLIGTLKCLQVGLGIYIIHNVCTDNVVYIGGRRPDEALSGQEKRTAMPGRAPRS